MTGYMRELNELTGHNSTPPASGGTYTLDGVQACAYARIRYGGGDDYRRTERQRTVLTAMMQKAQKSNITLAIQPVFHMKKQHTNTIRSVMLLFHVILPLTSHNYISSYLMITITHHLQPCFLTVSRSFPIQDINRETAIKAVSLCLSVIIQFIYFFPDGIHSFCLSLYWHLQLSFASFYQQSPL